MLPWIAAIAGVLTSRSAAAIAEGMASTTANINVISNQLFFIMKSLIFRRRIGGLLRGFLLLLELPRLRR